MTENTHCFPMPHEPWVWMTEEQAHWLAVDQAEKIVAEAAKSGVTLDFDAEMADALDAMYDAEDRAWQAHPASELKLEVL